MTGRRIVWLEGLRDLLADVAAELATRRVRTALTLVAVALSTGALLASTGLSRSASSEIDAGIAAATLNEVTVGVDPDGSDDVSHVLPDDTEERASSIALVEAAGRLLDTTGATDAKVSRQRPSGTSETVRVLLAGATPGFLAAAGVSVPDGRGWFLDGVDPIAFLGRDAARLLDVPVAAVPTGYRVWIGDQAYEVGGFIDGPSAAGLGSAVLIPYRRAVDLVGGDARAQVLLRTAPGAGPAVTRVARVAIRPDAPDRLTVSQVQSLDDVRQGVNTELGRLAAGVGLFLAVLTGLLIGNTMVVSVVARTGEIGLRRSLGASRRAVARVFLVEGAVVGLIGGLAGSAVAVLLVDAVALANQWPARPGVTTVLLGPLLGGSIGFASSAYPAVRAGRLSPALAIRAA